MQEGKQPLRARLQLLARLTLNAGEDAANQPARLAQLDDGNDRPILVQGHEGPAQIVRLGHRGTPSIDVSDEIAILAARPIASLRWREIVWTPSAGQGRFWLGTVMSVAGLCPACSRGQWPLALMDCPPPEAPIWISRLMRIPSQRVCLGSRSD